MSGPAHVFLQIGKTGGSALRDLIDRAAPPAGTALLLLAHATSLAAAAHQHPVARIGFVLRDPVDRAVSGFLSRLRFGRPRYDNPWKKAESRVFTRFATPEALGLALAEHDPEATLALTSIQHLKMDYPHYLGAPEVVQSLRHRIFFFGHLPTLSQDIAQLKRYLGLPHDLMLSTDPVTAHRNPSPDLATSATAHVTALHGHSRRMGRFMPTA